MAPARSLLVIKSLLLLLLFFLFSSVSCKVTLRNPGFESPPLNLTANATSQFVLLDTRINVIPGWSFNGTVWYVTAGENISLPGPGHGLQLGPNGTINQTFKPDGSYDYVLTFTIAPSSMDCANNSTAVNVSGPAVSDVFFFQESFGSEMWQTYAFSLGSEENRKGLVSLQIQSVATGSRHSNNITACWPIIDDLMVAGIESPIMYSDNGLVNSGFEIGPSFMTDSSQGVLLKADSNNDPSNSIKSPLQDWTISGIVKYIDWKHYAVPRGRAAVELVSGYPSGITANVFVLKQAKGEVSLDFIMGDANDSCVGDLTVFVQVGSSIWNFTMRSIGIGSRERHSVTFKAEFNDIDSVPISFSSFNETRSSDHRLLCGPVIDGTILRFSGSFGLEERRHKPFVIFSLVLAITFLFVV